MGVQVISCVSKKNYVVVVVNNFNTICIFPFHSFGHQLLNVFKPALRTEARQNEGCSTDFARGICIHPR